jgi:hypothetical protein
LLFGEISWSGLSEEEFPLSSLDDWGWLSLWDIGPKLSDFDSFTVWSWDSSSPSDGRSDSIVPITMIYGSVKKRLFTLVLFKTSPLVALVRASDGLISSNTWFGHLHWVRGLFPVLEVVFSSSLWPDHLELKFAISTSSTLESIENGIVWCVWSIDVPRFPLFFGEIGWSGLSEEELPLILDWLSLWWCWDFSFLDSELVEVGDSPVHHTT